MYGYKWATNWQNFTEIYLLLQKFTESKYCTKVLGDYLFDSHCSIIVAFRAHYKFTYLLTYLRELNFMAESIH